MLAADNGQFGVVEFLLEDGVDLTKVVTNGQTALHLAAWSGHSEIVSLLMAYGASLTVRDKDGRLQIDVAANEAIRVLIHDELSRRMDYKRNVILDPDVEQASKSPRLKGVEKEEGEGQSSTTASASHIVEELKYEEEVNGDSASSEEDEKYK